MCDGDAIMSLRATSSAWAFARSAAHPTHGGCQVCAVSISRASHVAAYRYGACVPAQFRGRRELLWERIDTGE